MGAGLSATAKAAPKGSTSTTTTPQKGVGAKQQLTKSDDTSLQKKDAVVQGKSASGASVMGKGGVSSTRPAPTTPTKRGVQGTAQSRNPAAVSAVGGRGARGGAATTPGARKQLDMGGKGGQSVDKRKMSKEERLYAPRVRKNPAEIKQRQHPQTYARPSSRPG